MGQVTNVQMETNSIRLEWNAVPENPYRVFVSEDLVGPGWSNLSPEGLVFSDAQGFYNLPMSERAGFSFAVASDYMIVDLVEGPGATNYPVIYTNEVPEEGWVDEYQTVKIVLRRIPGGSFEMGSPTNEMGRNSEERQRVVQLTKDVYVGVFEVTQKQWERVMGTWPSFFDNHVYRDSRPVEMVSYNDIRGTVAGTNWPTDNSVDTNSFLGRLRTKTRQAFDLPTEAQWEYACRAGTTHALNSGCDLTNEVDDVQMDVVGRYWYNGGSGHSSGGDVGVATAKVGSYLPSPWGLYDMHGNVWEWCLDWYTNAPAGTIDPLGEGAGSSRVARGGSWINAAWVCRSAHRGAADPGYGDGTLGFRLVRTLP